MRGYFALCFLIRIALLIAFNILIILVEFCLFAANFVAKLLVLAFLLEMSIMHYLNCGHDQDDNKEVDWYENRSVYSKRTNGSHI